MLFSRRINEYRPTIILAVFVLVSLASLATGKHASFIRHGVSTVVSVTSYPFLKAIRTIEGGYNYVHGMFFAYNAAIKEAEVSRQRLVEVTRNAAQRNELMAENKRLRRMLNFVRNEPGFTFVPAGVVQNFLDMGVAKIDCGSMSGIEQSMCAVTEQGIVGFVTEVDPTSALITTLHSDDFKVGAMIARNRVRGRVQGSRRNITRYCTMEYIDMKDDVREKDIVVTSTESIFFPPGYLIGRVVAVHDTGSVWKTADVEPAVDPYTLDEVFILRQAVTPEEELKANQNSTGPVSVAPKLPDMRSLQDRFAP